MKLLYNRQHFFLHVLTMSTLLNFFEYVLNLAKTCFEIQNKVQLRPTKKRAQNPKCS